MAAIDPMTAGAVFLATAATDAVYVMFTSAVVARKRVPAATWSSVWYVLSSYAVISYTENWMYVAFAAIGSWVGAYLTITFLHRPPGGPPVGAAPEYDRHCERQHLSRVDGFFACARNDGWSPSARTYLTCRGSGSAGELRTPSRR